MKLYPTPRTLSILALIAALGLPGAIGLTGCSSSTEPEPEAAEIPLTDAAATVDTPEEELFADAKRYYENELYTVSRDSFKSISASYALGAYAEFAEVKAADSFFEVRDYPTARALYEEFLKNHPASRALPYMLLRAGRSNQLAHRGVGRDPANLERAIEHYDLLIKRYPDSVYARAAQSHRAECLRLLIEGEEQIAGFYRSRKNDKAAEARTQVAAATWAPRLAETESALSRELVTDPAVVAQILAASRAHPLPVSEASAAPANPGSARAPEQVRAPANSARYQISHAECRGEGDSRQVHLFLNSELADETFLRRHARLVPEAGAVVLSIPEASAPEMTMNCFGTRDLALTAAGTLKLQSTRPFELMSLSNPPRLLLIGGDHAVLVRSNRGPPGAQMHRALRD